MAKFTKEMNETFNEQEQSVNSTNEPSNKQIYSKEDINKLFDERKAELLEELKKTNPKFFEQTADKKAGRPKKYDDIEGTKLVTFRMTEENFNLLNEYSNKHFNGNRTDTINYLLLEGITREGN